MATSIGAIANRSSVLTRPTAWRSDSGGAADSGAPPADSWHAHADLPVPGPLSSPEHVLHPARAYCQDESTGRKPFAHARGLWGATVSAAHRGRYDGPLIRRAERRSGTASLRWRSRGGGHLQDQRVAVPAPAAECGDADPAAAAAQLEGQVQHDPRAAHTDRVTQGDRAERPGISAAYPHLRGVVGTDSSRWRASSLGPIGAHCTASRIATTRSSAPTPATTARGRRPFRHL